MLSTAPASLLPPRSLPIPTSKPPPEPAKAKYPSLFHRIYRCGHPDEIIHVDVSSPQTSPTPSVVHTVLPTMPVLISEFELPTFSLEKCFQCALAACGPNATLRSISVMQGKRERAASRKKDKEKRDGFADALEAFRKGVRSTRAVDAPAHPAGDIAKEQEAISRMASYEYGARRWERAERRQGNMRMVKMMEIERAVISLPDWLFEEDEAPRVRSTNTWPLAHLHKCGEEDPDGERFGEDISKPVDRNSGDLVQSSRPKGFPGSPDALDRENNLGNSPVGSPGIPEEPMPFRSSAIRKTSRNIPPRHLATPDSGQRCVDSINEAENQHFEKSATFPTTTANPGPTRREGLYGINPIEEPEDLPQRRVRSPESGQRYMDPINEAVEHHFGRAATYPLTPANPSPPNLDRIPDSRDFINRSESPEHFPERLTSSVPTTLGDKRSATWDQGPSNKAQFNRYHQVYKQRPRAVTEGSNSSSPPLSPKSGQNLQWQPQPHTSHTGNMTPTSPTHLSSPNTPISPKTKRGILGRFGSGMAKVGESLKRKDSKTSVGSEDKVAVGGKREARHSAESANVRSPLRLSTETANVRSPRRHSERTYRSTDAELMQSSAEMRGGEVPAAGIQKSVMDKKATGDGAAMYRKKFMRSLAETRGGAMPNVGLQRSMSKTMPVGRSSEVATARLSADPRSMRSSTE